MRNKKFSFILTLCLLLGLCPSSTPLAETLSKSTGVKINGKIMGLGGSYYATTDSDGEVTMYSNEPADGNWNLFFDKSTGTLHMKNATIKNTISNQIAITDYDNLLTIDAQGDCNIEGSRNGIVSSYAGSSLQITGNGNLSIRGVDNDGIVINNGNLLVKDFTGNLLVSSNKSSGIFLRSGYMDVSVDGNVTFSGGISYGSQSYSVLNNSNKNVTISASNITLDGGLSSQSSDSTVNLMAKNDINCLKKPIACLNGTLVMAGNTISIQCPPGTANIVASDITIDAKTSFQVTDPSYIVSLKGLPVKLTGIVPVSTKVSVIKSFTDPSVEVNVLVPSGKTLTNNGIITTTGEIVVDGTLDNTDTINTLKVNKSTGAVVNNSGKINETNHTFPDWVTTKPATCTVDGSREHICEICGFKEIETIKATGHSFDSKWSYDETNHWHQCTSEDGKSDFGNHVFGDWIIVNESTTTVEGTHKKVCDCGYSVTEKLPLKETSISNKTDSSNSNQTAPKTGDNNSLNLWISLLLISSVSLITIFAYKSKKKSMN